MFLYVRDIKTEKEAMDAVNKGAVALAVSLSPKRNMEAENTRTWLEDLPMQIMKIGEFDDEMYYDIEEMSTFCHLDVLLLRDLRTVKDFSHYTGRVMVEITEWELQDMKRFDDDAYRTFLKTADGIRLRVTDYTNLDNSLFWQYLQDLQKPVFLAMDLEGGSVNSAMEFLSAKNIPNLAALFVDYADLV
ncbi:MAG: hypothetical protein ACOX7J_03865 [Bacillota bacterium]|jgi:hypothetical protein